MCSYREVFLSFIVSYLQHPLFMKLKVIFNLFTDLSSRRSSVLLSDRSVDIKNSSIAAGQLCIVVVCVVAPQRIDARQRVVYSRMQSLTLTGILSFVRGFTCPGVFFPRSIGLVLGSVGLVG